MSNFFAIALGCGTKNRNDNWLEVFYPDPAINPDNKLVEVIREELGWFSPCWKPMRSRRPPRRPT